MLLTNFLKWTLNNQTYTNLGGTNTGQGSMGGNISAYVNGGTAYYGVSAMGSYVDVGFGNTPEDPSDYKLANSNAIDTPTLTFISNGYAISGTYPYVRNLTTTYANNTANPVTITEVGYVQQSTGTLNNSILMTRTVLDSAIIVPAGGTVAITITLEC